MSRYSIDLSRLGPYRLIEKLGVGAMGTVFLAEEEGDPVAIKLIHPHLVEREGFFKRFQREAEAGQRVDHPNVVRTLECDFVWTGETPLCFLVMEHVEGSTLRDLVNELGTIPEGMLREVAAQTAAGLGAIHAEGIVHRDLKPENVLITKDQQVRIMDLGVAKIQDAETLTLAGQFAGSLLYAAPEQIQERTVGSYTDLYSLGVMIYELATGQNPFKRDEPIAMINAHLGLVPPRMSDVSSEVSTFLSEVVATLMEKEPDDRFTSAESLREVLAGGEKSTWWTEREPELLRLRRSLPRISVRRETVFHAREAELARMDAAWALAGDGEGSTF
ncbi:MAG: serine/threonine-protein kinase, partial [Planctomycetota bacterium]